MLKSGARIAVVAPAGRFDPDRLERGMSVVRGWGYELVEGPNLHGEHRFFAGTVEQRTADLVWALTDPDIDAVWFARGGYGTALTLNGLPWDDMDDRPVLGFSDATAMFSAMSARGIGAGIHGPVLHSMHDHVDAETQEAVRALLVEGRKPNMRGAALLGSGSVVEGPVVGGNLCVIASLIGTPWALNATDSIVLLEDVGEAPYRIDRTLCQLLEGGCLSKAVGIALGTFAGCDAPPDAGWGLMDIIRDRLAPLGIPVIYGLPVGHGLANQPWCMGAVAKLDKRGLHWEPT